MRRCCFNSSAVLSVVLVEINVLMLIISAGAAKDKKKSPNRL